MENKVIFYKIDMLSRHTLSEVLEGIVDECTRSGASAAVVSFDDCPFINEKLTNELIERHFKYAAEYTFADGYPGGLAPEVLDAGTAKILLEMVKREGKGDAPMTRTGLWDLIKTDVNAFEIETIIAPHDYRLWRLDFHTGDKRGALSCHALAGALLVAMGQIPADADDEDMGQIPAAGQRPSASPWTMDADDLSQIAIHSIRVVRTVPAFYQVQTQSFEETGMPLDKFTGLVGQMKALSGDAVVSIDAADPDYVEILAKAGLDILIEIGEEVTEDIIARCHDIDPDIRWIVECTSSYMDYVSGAAGGDEMAHTVERLNHSFPGRVYPQLVRTTETESVLEEFYRKWSAADSPSGGKVLITKYCSYCGSLPDLKPADFAPLERNPCWHLRRDMVILADGTVPLCFARVHSLQDEGNILGNAFDEGLAALWDKMEPYAENDLNGERDDLCRKCDEYYTFNF